MFSSDVLLGGLILALIQILAALPWLWAIDPKGFVRTFRDPAAIASALIPVGFIIIGMAAFIGYKGDSTNLALYGRFYGAILHLQILIDLFIFTPMLLTLFAPKVGAVALAAYREGWRQPMFWLVMLVGLGLTWFSVYLPYFTFGDDFKMMKQIGFDIIMLCSVLFGVLAASISISEEIEGRTAITVMSKPINRRQFLMGKFFGILMACAAMSLVLAWNFNWALVVMPEYDPINKDRAYDPMPEQAKQILVPWMESAVGIGGPAQRIAEGTGKWFGESFANTVGVMLGFGQVMILVSVATALATRLPFVANLVLCLVVYFLGNLAPVVVKVTEKMSSDEGGSTGVRLIKFLGNLFDTLMPALEFFKMGPAIIRETPLDLWEFTIYGLTVFGYAIIYTMIALLVGLLLFEDRDLA